MNTVLVTGFQPFGEWTDNPSQSIAEVLDGCEIAGYRVTGLVLPVVFGEDIALVLPAIQELKPALVLSFGLDAGAKSVNVEMFAINHRVSEKGGPLIPIIPAVPAAYFATIDIDAVVAAITDKTNVPTSRHGYAGTYLCNHIFYQTLHYCAEHQLQTKVGFIHVPKTMIAPSDAANWKPPILDELVEAARVAVGAIVQDRDTTKVSSLK